MTMTFSSSISNQLDFDHTLAAITTATRRSRNTRPNRTTRRRSVLDDKQTSYSVMNRQSLLAIMQVPTITRLIGKYSGATGEPSLRPEPPDGPDEQLDEEEIFHDATDVIQLGAVESELELAHERETAPCGARSAKLPAGDWQLECKYTLSEVQQHSSLEDCWMVIFDKVYNITDFVHEHPGGDFILFEYAGRDATHPFLSSRHGSSAYKMLDKYWIGILVDEELYYSNNSSYCSVYLDLSWRSTPTLEDANNNSTTGTASSTSHTSGSSYLSD